MKTTRTDNVKGYKIDFCTNTLIMNYKFANAALNDYGSPEYERMKSILADFPNMQVIVKAGRKVTTTRPNKRLTYANMETYIKAYDNATELLEVFETVKNLSKPLASPYKYVVDWFTAQFPNYNKISFPQNEKPTILPVSPPDKSDYKNKFDKAG